MKFILLYVITFQLLLANRPIALITKVRGNVSHKLIAEGKYKTKTKINTPIYSESQILVEENSFAKIVFLDDGTAISIYLNSEVLIKGSIHKRKISKEVEIITGISYVNVSIQSEKDFKYITPNSELTCDECRFWLMSDNINGDQFIKEDGEISIWNPSINRTQELEIDSTLNSIINQEFFQFETPVTDIKFLESLMLDFDERTLQTMEENQEEFSPVKVTNEVIIKLKNAANVEREIIITYTQ